MATQKLGGQVGLPKAQFSPWSRGRELWLRSHLCQLPLGLGERCQAWSGPHAWLGQAEPAGAADGAGGGERIKILVSSRWVRMIQWIRLGAAPGCGALLN